MLHRCEIIACKRRAFSELTGCETLTTYGYRFSCSCGERGKVRRAYAVASDEGRTHRQEITKG
jgi:hypothetical protein